MVAGFGLTDEELGIELPKTKNHRFVVDSCINLLQSRLACAGLQLVRQDREKARIQYLKEP